MASPIFLTGMMGSGKSTVGRILAQETGASFVDLDRRIERLFGRTIESLFGEGEPRFRELERVALTSLVAEPGFQGRNVVVATGGGIVIDPNNRDTMSTAGRVVFLSVSVDLLVARLEPAAQEQGRPLLTTTQRGVRHRLEGLLAARRGAYRDRSLVVDADASPEVVAQRIGRVLCGASNARDSEAV